jgi:hypothetical protein
MNWLRRLLRFLIHWLASRGDFTAGFDFVSFALSVDTNGRYKDHIYFYGDTSMSTSLSIKLGGGDMHTAVLTCLNLDGTPADNVTITYASSDTSVALVDPNTGAITAVTVGTCNVTGSGTRNGFTHEDSGTLTVEAAGGGTGNSGDFTASLALT